MVNSEFFPEIETSNQEQGIKKAGKNTAHIKTRVADITDSELEYHIERQQVLNKAGIGIYTLTGLLEKVH